MPSKNSSTKNQINAVQNAPSSHEPQTTKRVWLPGEIGVPFRNRNFRLLFSGQLISNIGDAFYLVALPWFILNSGGGAQGLGFALTAYGVPRIVTILLGGPLSDRLHPRRVMLLSDVARLLLTGILAVVMLQRHPAFWILYTLLALVGGFSGLFTPAVWSITPYILSNDVLQAGNAIRTSSMQIATFIGSALAGIIVSRFQPGIALALDSLSFAVSALTLAFMHNTDYISKEQTSETQEGTLAIQIPVTFWQLLRTARHLQILLVMVTFMNLGGGAALEVGLPVFTHDFLKAGAFGYSIIVATFSVGALVGALGAGALGKLPRRGIAFSIIFTIQAFAMTLVPFLSSVLAASVAMLVAGLMNGSGNVTSMTLIQQTLPRHLMGRIMGAFAFTNFGFYPLSVALGGILVAHYGSVLAFLLNGALISVPCILSLFSSEFRKLE